jgi:predicted methyltransferase
MNSRALNMKHLVVLLALLVPVALPAAEPMAADYAAALANPARSAKDRERDARDRPAEILAVAGVRAGMAVADVFGAGGYWSELLAYTVGPTGRVLLVNNPAYVEFAKKELDARFAGGRLSAVERTVVDPKDLGLGTGTLDAALIVMSYHDLYYVDEKGGWPAIDAGQFLGQVHAALKPGGAFLIVDHSAKPGTGAADAQTLHRIDEAFAQQDLEKHGFRLEKTWDGLRHPEDDRTKLVFDPAIRGKTDRFVHLYRRE